jgi:hypothetical protein
VLTSLDRLGYLCVTIELMCRIEPKPRRHPVKAELLLEVLLPLKAVRARSFAVVIPEGIDSVRERLGEVPFRLVERLSASSLPYGFGIGLPMAHEQCRILEA